MEDLKKIQEFFSKPLEEVTKSQMLKKAKKGSYPATLVAIENGKVVAQEKVSTPQEAPAAHSVMSKKYPNANIRLEDSTGKILEENVDKKYSDFLVALRDSGVTNMFGAAPYLQAEFGLDKREAREVLANWMRSFGESLNEVSGDIDLEDFAKVVQAVHQTDHPATLLLSPMFGKDEIEIIVGQDAPDSIIDDIFNVMTDLGYKSGTDYSIVGDTSSLSRRSYSQIRRVNGGHKNYFEESLDEVNDPRIDNPKFGPSPRKFAELRAQMGDKALLDKIQMMNVNVLVDVLDELDVDGVDEAIEETKKLTYDNFIQMVRDDMNSGSASDENVSDEQVKKVAKQKYNEYLQGTSLDDLFEVTKEEENEFHKKLDKLVHKTFGHSSDEKEEMEEYNSGIYYDPAKSSSRPKAKEASKSGLEKVRDFVKKVMKEEEITVDDATDFKVNLKHLLDKHKVKGEALSDFEEEEANYDELYSDYKYKVDEAKPKKGHGEKISKEVFSKLKGKTINYKGADYKVLDSDEAVLKIKHLEDGDTTTINLSQFNVSGMIDEILETIELGKNLNEELCPKGKAYIKKRQAAGEKSSAYLSGRAVKVCKGQMKG